MIRLYSLGLLLPLSIPALAQQPDTLILHRVGVAVQPDSLPSINYPILSGILSCSIAGVPIKPYYFTPLLPLQEQLRQVAGVQATPYSGAPGAQVAVRIRGAASLASNAQPLYVVDGVPVFQNTFRVNTTNMLGALVPAEVQELDNNPLMSIPSEDITSVEVLKGAYETALYGSQGLNGVIRITTKRGNTGKPRLRYTGYGGVQQARNRYELLDAQEYGALRNEVAERRNQPVPYTPAQLAAFGKGTDWQDELLRTAAVQEHHLGLSGGTATTRYYAAADYLNQQGVVLTSRLRRYAARAALNQQLSQHLHLEATGSFAQTEQRIPAYYALPNALLTPPTQSTTDNPRPGYYVNPLDLARQSYQAPAQQRLLAQLGVRYELTPGLTLDVRGSLEQATLRSRSYQPAFATMPAGENGNLTLTYRQLFLNPALRYAHSFGGERHAVTASLEAQRQDRNTTAEQATYTPGAGGMGGNGSREQYQLNFYQLTAGYTFDERYQVRGSLRRDGSSTFTSQDRWSWLPGAQVLWHAAKENFWNTAPARLDAWVGWGRTSGAGNQGRNFLQLPVPTGAGVGQTLPIFLPELTQQLDAGVEADLFNNHLTLTAQAYARRTTSTFYVPSSTLPAAGTTQDTYLRNRGLELTARSSWQAGKLQGSSQLAAALNRNRYESNTTIFYSSPYHRTLDGQPIGTFYGLRNQGLDATGNLRYQDVNGDGQFNFLDQQPLGSGLPRQLLSFSQQLTLGRFEAQLQADGMFGYQVYNTSLQALDATGGFTNSSSRVLSRWTPANTATEVPVAGTNLPVFSSYTLQSGNHVRLSALTVSYRVWEKEARNVQLWTSGLNLLVLSKYWGYDPNVSSAGSDNQQAGLDAGAYPVARTFLVGVRATL
ncbi:SusC/RagA family TonB-linked outer membrane protein [Hymenobacter rigui]|uniref:SusC/RagA family TonB-linked outer membrane protein n=1 Tax=Hymenobacter rigui TaxID=334424 RepID=A0A428KW18_9BACT|nr:SusC/RagA family TonB-linked outer membrane protein [Hymenobacter rigui]RSK50887.1 SusC/RagA family TonB-linked outer membrane protein [Hymenobacter rigui]